MEGMQGGRDGNPLPPKFFYSVATTLCLYSKCNEINQQTNQQTNLSIRPIYPSWRASNSYTTLTCR